MRSPSSPMLRIAVGAICFGLACGRSTSAPFPSADAAPGAGGIINETGGTSGTTDAPVVGGAPTGGTQVGQAGQSGGAIASGGGPGTGGRAGAEATGGVGKGGVSGIDAGGPLSTGGTILGTGGASGADATGSGGTAGIGGTTSAGGTAGSIVLPPKFFGNIDTRGTVPSDFATYWDQLTPENSGKWASAQSSLSTFRWSSLDTMYKYCEDNKILFKQHCFIWGAGQPSWLNSSNAAELAQNWMKSFCDRYPKTRIIDVVNEPLHSPPTYKEGLGGAGASGWDWIVNSFKWAHEACPNAILVVSDYNVIEYASDHKKMVDLVKASLAAGAPIMAVGAQAHDVAKVPLSTVQTYLADLIAQTGLPVYITQMDLPIRDDVEQATMMKDLVTTLWNDPNVPGITYWGYIVGATWRDNTGLMTSTGVMRPAMTWLMDFLGR